MPRAPDARKAMGLTKMVRKLGDAASFRNILREAARAGILREPPQSGLSKYPLVRNSMILVTSL